ncbi:DUF1842 domain-containing protein [Pseudoalteromonas luteoviolacea]|nr:DUF1842 domain-containing protein [Pseudoalteromonas luteoviolacea]MBQ4879298.1 DUF1842 domain-containing protein [Pseudoalteromonas luteoviolacea]MBQ4908358.1 DUF1842 domain-containing protein [Pseudoalteromonas luteoviolacea]
MQMTQCGINGLFLINYLIGQQNQSPLCQMSLLVYTPDKTLSGRAKLLSSSPRKDALMFHLNGEFHYRDTSDPHPIAINLLGQQAQPCPHQQNSPYHYIKLNILLNEHWRSGQVELCYRDLRADTWQHQPQLSIHQTHNNNISDLAQLALQVKS